MALLEVHCNKCGEDFKLDIGDRTVEQVKDHLSGQDTFHCPGKHVELSSPMNYWVLGAVTEGKAPTDEEWLAKMKERHGELISNDELREKFEITGFAMGTAIGYDRATREKVYLDFGNSPEGHRYYWRL